MKPIHLLVVALAIVGALAGCTGTQTTATPQEEEKFRNPDKNPPPEAVPGGPPPEAAQGGTK